VQNFVGNLAGAIAPALTGFLLDRTGSFFWPFLITGLVAWIGGVGWWYVVGSLDEVNWDNRSAASLPGPIAAPESSRA